jgi:hypothetical protein
MRAHPATLLTEAVKECRRREAGILQIVHTLMQEQGVRSSDDAGRIRKATQRTGYRLLLRREAREATRWVLRRLRALSLPGITPVTRQHACVTFAS